MPDEPRRLADCLRRGRLTELLRESDRRRTATAAILKQLPAEESAHVVSAAPNSDGVLVIVMDSPSWAARVRYCLDALPYERVKIKVLPRGGS